MDATSHQSDPYADFNFMIDIDGMKGGFSEANGLPTDGDSPKLQELRNCTSLVLKRGLTTNKDLWEWCKTATDGKSRCLSGSIAVFDEARSVVSVWRFKGARPTKVEGPALNATANEVAIEELEIVVEGLQLMPSDDETKP